MKTVFMPRADGNGRPNERVDAYPVRPTVSTLGGGDPGAQDLRGYPIKPTEAAFGAEDPPLKTPANDAILARLSPARQEIAEIADYRWSPAGRRARAGKVVVTTLGLVMIAMAGSAWWAHYDVDTTVEKARQTSLEAVAASKQQQQLAEVAPVAPPAPEPVTATLQVKSRDSASTLSTDTPSQSNVVVVPVEEARPEPAKDMPATTEEAKAPEKVEEKPQEAPAVALLQPDPPPQPKAEEKTAPPAEPAAAQPAEPAAAPAPAPEPPAAKVEVKPEPAAAAPAPAPEPQPPTEVAVAPSPPAAPAAPEAVVPPSPPSPPPAASPAAPAPAPSLLQEGQRLLQQGNVEKARTLFEEAANKGQVEAAFALGSTYDAKSLAASGLSNVTPDASKALYWYKQAHLLAAGRPASRH